MRKLILFVLAAAMLIGGLYVVALILFSTRIISFWLFFGGGVLAFAGAYLMWTDFIAPRLGVKTWED
jgi:hypothetical protein